MAPEWATVTVADKTFDSLCGWPRSNRPAGVPSVSDAFAFAGVAAWWSGLPSMW